MEPEQPHIEVNWGPATLEVLTSFCKEHLDPLGESELSLSVQLVVEELVTNVVQYGYKGAEGSVEVSLDIERQTVTLTLRDRSPEFNPFLLVTGNAGQDEGGRGLSIVRRLAETTLYERNSKGENILQCTFPRSTGQQ